MKASDQYTIYTIGHSTRSLDEFVKMLQSFDISTLIDVRHYPGSRKFPHFNKESLAASLKEVEIQYTHLVGLGGRRKVQKGSTNTRWRNDSFQGYADYMETEAFERTAAKLEAIASEQTTTYMCAEAVWWRCHRSMVSDYLKAKGWKVLHIMRVGKADEHPYTSPARVVGGRVSYSEKDLFNQ